MSSTDFSHQGIDETTQTIETLEKAFTKLKDATGNIIKQLIYLLLHLKKFIDKIIRGTINYNLC